MKPQFNEEASATLAHVGHNYADEATVQLIGDCILICPVLGPNNVLVVSMKVDLARQISDALATLVARYDGKLQ